MPGAKSIYVDRVERTRPPRRPGYPLPVEFAGLPTAMAWQSTIWQMAQYNTPVISTGCRCKRYERVSLLRMYLLLGWNGSLWDRRHPCDHCGDFRHFMASPGEGSVMRPMITGLMPEQLPWQAWLDGWRCPDHTLIYPVNEPPWIWRPRAVIKSPMATDPPEPAASLLTDAP